MAAMATACPGWAVGVVAGACHPSVGTVTMGECSLPVLGQRFICSFPDCTKTYNKNWKLQVHLCKHTGERPFGCDFEGCDKGFTRKYHLARHMLTHTGEKSVKCDSEECNLMFITKQNMRRHFNRAHVHQGQVYECDFPDCSLKFKKHNQLRIHHCTHTNEQPYKCSFDGCDKSFLVPSRLKRHEKVHAGYKCKKDEWCPFVGKTWSEYILHVAEYHKEPAICDVCKRRFSHARYLKDHKAVHDEERYVYCCPRESCDRSYISASSLQTHILTYHEGKRPFVCEHASCGKTFTLKASLRRHHSIHNPGQKKVTKKPRPKRSLASRLAGYKPRKAASPPEEKPDKERDPSPSAGVEHAQLEQLSLK
uniref:Transcription factor IIIA n=1 Tax=Leptobrachium leishanense TaxID=445787 RepID=A0A8C5PNZ6_9ANUR